MDNERTELDVLQIKNLQLRLASDVQDLIIAQVSKGSARVCTREKDKVFKDNREDRDGVGMAATCHQTQSSNFSPISCIHSCCPHSFYLLS